MANSNLTQWGAGWLLRGRLRRTPWAVFGTRHWLSKLLKIRGNVFYLETMPTDVFILQFSVHHRVCYRMSAQVKKRHTATGSVLPKYWIMKYMSANQSSELQRKAEATKESTGKGRIRHFYSPVCSQFALLICGPGTSCQLYREHFSCPRFVCE